MIKNIIFLGTGPSSGLPNIHCITSKSECKVCESSLDINKQKNVRGNISLLIQWQIGGEIKNIILDCGKTFYSSTVKHFIKNEIRNIDAVILTHGHADAMLGLDDLRPCTFDTVKETFPYLVDTNKATGGGAVAKLDFILIDEYKPFNVFGLEFLPLPVEHGYHFNKSPYISFAYKFEDICFVSDTSKIPEKSKQFMLNCNILILDLLRREPYTSHLGFDDMLKQCTSIKPSTCYTVGMAHELDHYELEEEMKSLNLDFKLEPAYDGLKIEF